MNLAVDSLVGGKIHSFDKERIAQTEMRHAASAKTMLGFARLGEYDESGF